MRFKKREMTLFLFAGAVAVLCVVVSGLDRITDGRSPQEKSKIISEISDSLAFKAFKESAPAAAVSPNTIPMHDVVSRIAAAKAIRIVQLTPDALKAKRMTCECSVVGSLSDIVSMIASIENDPSGITVEALHVAPAEHNTVKADLAFTR